MLCLFLTNKCSFECAHCLANAGPGRKRFMTEEVFRAALDTFDNCSINLCGGEPTLHPKFASFLWDACNEANDMVRVVTNGEWWMMGDLYEFDEPDTEDEDNPYYSMDETDVEIGFATDFYATEKTVEVGKAVLEASIRLPDYATLNIHLSNDRWHQWFTTEQNIIAAKNFLQSLTEGGNVEVSTDHNYFRNKRYVIPVGRGKEVCDFSDERGLCCECSIICDTEHSFFSDGYINDDVRDHFEDRFNSLNVFYDGQVSPCEGGLYMFANVLEHDEEKIKRMFSVVYRYIQHVFANCKEEGVRGLEMCKICQRAFPYFKRHILPSIECVEEKAYVDGAREALSRS